MSKNLSGEEWRPVVGYEGLYEVSNMGRVKSLDRDLLYQDGTIHHWRGRIMKPLKSTNRYLQIMFRKDNHNHYMSIHRVVAMAFVEGYKEGLTVNHLDENPQNNRAENLEWCTQKENNNYGTARERSVKKISVPILQFSYTGELIKEWKSQTEAAKTLGINQAHIFRCLQGSLLSAFGYRWMYKSEYDKGKQLQRYNAVTGKKKVMQMDKEGKIIRIWNCTREVERELGFNHSVIGKCAKGDTKRGFSYGFKWKYL